MPGATGQSPGLHVNVLPINAPAVLLACAGSLALGIVLGPEAPLVILGTTIGALVLRGRPEPVIQLGMLLGGAAAVGLIFGNPFTTAFMLLEFAAMGAMPAVALLPAFVALGTGYLVQVGVGSWWSGLRLHAPSVPGMPAYTQETIRDLIFGPSSPSSPASVPPSRASSASRLLPSPRVIADWCYGAPLYSPVSSPSSSRRSPTSGTTSSCSPVRTA